MTAANSLADRAVLGDQDAFLFNEGSHYRLYEKLGAHPCTRDGKAGTQFAVWAPSAQYVAVVGDFNGWDRGQHPLKPFGSSGMWVGFVPGVGNGLIYKYHVASKFDGYTSDKADPVGFFAEVAPKTASVVWDLTYEWSDAVWMASRKDHNSLKAPISIYEMHLGSWMRVAEDGNRSLSYREIAPRLADHVEKCGFTHVEFLPLTEHPFFGSWGYQTTGFFAATSRYGTPQDLMYLIDYLHQRNIGVIMDWVPSHFPTDGLALAYFDGTHLYEHADPRQGFHPDWGQLHLQLRPARGAVVPHVQRPVLARQVPHRRPPRRRRGQHVVPRLLAQGRRVDPELLRRQRELRGHRLPAAVQRGRVPRVPGRADLRGGIDVVRRRVAADVRGRAGVRLQVGHGLDARHAQVPGPRADPPPLPPGGVCRSAWCTPTARTS